MVKLSKTNSQRESDEKKKVAKKHSGSLADRVDAGGAKKVVSEKHSRTGKRLHGVRRRAGKPQDAERVSEESEEYSSTTRYIESSLGIKSYTELAPSIMNLPDIQQKLRKFAEDRNWDQFHSPKNLSMALAAEAAELLEIFQWLTEEQSKDIVNSEKEIAQVKEEIADVFIYLARLADKLNIDIEKEVLAKIALNEKKYPINFSKNNAVKYNRR
jgi:NTP pyrophosphatase (non-canonical NTP hydrolase)